MSTTKRASRRVRQPLSRQSVNVRGISEAILRAAVQAARTAPRGARPGWLTDLEANLLREPRPERVTLDRLVALLAGSATCAADIEGAGAGLVAAIRGAVAEPAARVADALLHVEDAACLAIPLAARVLAGDTSTPAEMALLRELRRADAAIEDAVITLEVAVAPMERAA